MFYNNNIIGFCHLATLPEHQIHFNGFSYTLDRFSEYTTSLKIQRDKVFFLSFHIS